MAARRWIVVVVLDGLIGALLSGVVGLVVGFSVGLRCFLLVDTATLLFVSPTLRSTHAGPATKGVIASNAHISLVSGLPSLLIGSISTTLGSRSARRPGHRHTMPI